MSSDLPKIDPALVANRRSMRDRRQQIIRALIHGSFNPRRRGPRREQEASIVSVDWHHPQWLAVAMTILLLSCSDAVLTLLLLERGAYELNPFMAPLVHWSTTAFVACKIGLTAGGVIFLTILAHVRAFGRLHVGTMLYAVVVGYAVLVIYEAWLLDRIISFP